MQVAYNFAKVNSRAIIAEGTYPATIVAVKRMKNTKKGFPMKQVMFELSGGEHISDFIVVMEQTYWKIQNLLRACKQPYEGKVVMSEDWDELTGISLDILVGVEEYQGKKRNSISYFTDIEEKIMDEDVAKQKKAKGKSKKK